MFYKTERNIRIVNIVYVKIRTYLRIARHHTLCHKVYEISATVKIAVVFRSRIRNVNKNRAVAKQRPVANGAERCVYKKLVKLVVIGIYAHGIRIFGRGCGVNFAKFSFAVKLISYKPRRSERICCACSETLPCKA